MNRIGIYIGITTVTSKQSKLIGVCGDSVSFFSTCVPFILIDLNWMGRNLHRQSTGSRLTLCELVWRKSASPLTSSFCLAPTWRGAKRKEKKESTTWFDVVHCGAKLIVRTAQDFYPVILLLTYPICVFVQHLNRPTILAASSAKETWKGFW